MSDSVAFIGPSLGSIELPAGFEVCPPATVGDIYKAVRRGAATIALIDGYFEDRAAVWHKEILFAISNSVIVYGSSSMGALRAAELSEFGMIGVGKVFSWYKDGTLEDDAAVAVVHGPQELGYKSISTAHVDVFAIAASLRKDGVLTSAEAERIVSLSERVFYKDRTWASMWSILAETHGRTPALEYMLRSCGPESESQKSLDAQRLFQEIGTLPPRTVPDQDWSLEDTEWWNVFRKGQAANIRARSDSNEIYSLILDILRLRSDFHQVYSRAIKSVLASELAQMQGVTPSSDLLQDLSVKFRLKRKLDDVKQLENWFQRNHMDPIQFTELMHLDSEVGHILAHYSNDILGMMVLECKRDGTYPSLFSEAETGFHRLNSMGKWTANESVDADQRNDLMSWYFLTYLNREPPNSVSEFSGSRGFDSVDDFFASLFRFRLTIGAKDDHK